MNILLVEDHRLVADAMQMMLREIDPNTRITACYSTQHALGIVDEGKRFDLVITDLLMPGIDGLGLLTGLRNRRARMPVVIVSGADEDKYVRAAIDHGASGYIKKSLPAAEMMTGLRQVIAGGKYFPSEVVNLRPSDNPAEVNTEDDLPTPGVKQMQVLRLMADGNSNKQISQIVGISEATVKYHTSQLFKLLNVRNRTSCVKEAQRRGLLTNYDSA